MVFSRVLKARCVYGMCSCTSSPKLRRFCNLFAAFLREFSNPDSSPTAYSFYGFGFAIRFQFNRDCVVSTAMLFRNKRSILSLLWRCPITDEIKVVNVRLPNIKCAPREHIISIFMDFEEYGVDFTVFDG